MELIEGQTCQQDDTWFLECLRWRTKRNANKRLGEESKRAPAKLGEQALDAAYDGDLQLLRDLLDAGVARECQNVHGDTLLSEAAVGGQLEVVQFLLGIGARPNSHGRYRRTPLWRAAFNGHLEVARALLRSGGHPGDPDEAGEFPIDTCPNADLCAVLACWHMPFQDNLFEKNILTTEMSCRTPSKEAAEMSSLEESRQRRKQLQQKDLEEAISEAEKCCDIACAEAIRHAEEVQQLQEQHEACKTQAVADEMKAMQRSSKAFMEIDEARAMHNFTVAQQLAFRAEAMHQEAAQIAKELEWQVKRSYIKRKDWEGAEAWRQQVAKGQLLGFRTQVLLQNETDWGRIISDLSQELDLIAEVLSSDGVLLKPGDCLICEGPLLERVRSKEDLKKVHVELWPWTVWFNHGFDADVRFVDLGRGLKASAPRLDNIWSTDDERLFREDGRWPLFVDPTEATSTFFRYSTMSSHVFHILELSEPSDNREISMRLRHALVSAMFNGSTVVIDFGSTGLSLDIAKDPFDDIEKGLFGKLMSRGTLFTYLLPRHFASLIPTEFAREFCLQAFTDENLSSFALAFITSLRDPDAEFTRLFYKVRVRVRS